MTKEEAIRTIRKEAHDYPDRSAEFMADFTQVVISRIDGVPQHVETFAVVIKEGGAE